MNVLERLIDAGEAAQILGWDMQKLYRMAREGRVPVARKVGHVYLFFRESIEALAKEAESVEA